MIHLNKSVLSSNVGKRPRRTLDDQLVPMINVVFLLLIFFMIAGRIESSYKSSVTLPNSNTAKPLAVVEEPFFISREGQLIWQDKPMTLTQLNGVLHENFDKNTAIHVRADRATTAKTLSGFVDAVHAAGFGNVRFVTLENESTL